MDQLPRLGKRELICLLLFTCNYVVFVWRGFFFLLVLGIGYVILLWYSLNLPYNYYTVSVKDKKTNFLFLGEKRQTVNCLFRRETARKSRSFSAIFFGDFSRVSVQILMSQILIKCNSTFYLR